VKFECAGNEYEEFYKRLVTDKFVGLTIQKVAVRKEQLALDLTSNFQSSRLAAHCQKLDDVEETLALYFTLKH
jgi:hypothetical protein